MELRDYDPAALEWKLKRLKTDLKLALEWREIFENRIKVYEYVACDGHPFSRLFINSEFERANQLLNRKVREIIQTEAQIAKVEKLLREEAA